MRDYKFNIGPLLGIFIVITVASCGGGGSDEGSGTTNSQSSTPKIQSLSPSGVAAGSTGITLTINGSNFVTGATMLWGAAEFTTKYISSTQLQAQIPDYYLTNIDEVPVAVVNPVKGNNESNFATLYIGPSTPKISLLSPSFAVVGSNSMVLTVLGANFSNGEVAEWDGNALKTTFISSTELQVTVPSADLGKSGQKSVAIVNPSYAKSVSNALIFNIENSNSTDMLLDPSSAVVGDPGFILTVNGNAFTKQSIIKWNGISLPTIYVSANQLQALVSSTYLRNIGTAQVTVSDSIKTSPSFTFLIGNGGGPGYAFIDIQQAVNSLAWSQQYQLLYATVPSYSKNYPNTVISINPYSTRIENVQYSGSGPDLVAISGDKKYLYTSLDGGYAVQRFLLPSLAPDINCSLGDNYTLGPNTAMDLQVSPVNSGTIAVTLGNSGLGGIGAQSFEIMDNCSVRGSVLGAALTFTTSNNIQTIQWDSSGDKIYAANYDSIYTLGVSSSGASFLSDYPNVFYQNPNSPLFKIHYDLNTGLIYSDDGYVVDPNSGVVKGQYPVSGPMVPDSQGGLAFFSYTSREGITIESFGLLDFKAIGGISLPDETGNPEQILRWGNNGLVVATDDGQLYLVGGTFVDTGLSESPVGTPPAGPTGVLPLPNVPTVKPVLSGLSTSAVDSGSLGFNLEITGKNFVVGAQICWNGQPLETSFLSSSELIAVIPSENISNSGSVEITVCYVGYDAIVSRPLTLTIGPIAPEADMLSPAYATAGSNDLLLSVFGNNFVENDVVKWNGVSLDTNYISAHELQARVSSGFLSDVGSESITVADPGYLDSTSNPVGFNLVDTPVLRPTLNPGSAVAGDSQFTLTINDKGFSQSSVVIWNGIALPTTFISVNQLQAQVPAADIAHSGTASITVSTGLSVPNLTFFIGTSGGFGYAYIDITQAANDIIWSPQNNYLYMTTPGSAKNFPNSIAILDPYSASITSSQSAGISPNVLTASDDGKYLYVGIDGENSIQRFSLPSLTSDMNCSLGSGSGGEYRALDLQAAPDNPDIFAASLASPNADGGFITVFDDCVMRANQFPAEPSVDYPVNSIQWGASSDVLYGASTYTSFGQFYKLNVTSTGVNLAVSQYSTVYEPMHFDPISNLVYTDRGTAINPSTGLTAGTFGFAGVGVGGTVVYDSRLQQLAQMNINAMTVDSQNNLAFFAASLSTIPEQSGAIGIEIYNVSQYTKIGSFILSDTIGTLLYPTHIVRWGTNGLVLTAKDLINADNNHIYLVGGTLISGP